MKSVDSALQADFSTLNARLSNLLESFTTVSMDIRETKDGCKRGSAKFEHLIKASEVAIENRVKKMLEDFKHTRMANAAPIAESRASNNSHHTATTHEQSNLSEG
jgi:hypothetical protein